MPRIVASIEARMGSSRLPGKVLADIAGQPALTRLVRRLRRAKLVDDIVLATTVAPADDALVDWAVAEGVAVHRGSEDDVLQRVVDAHLAMGSEIVVEVTGDCPLLDPGVIDWAITMFRFNDCDVVSNTWHPGFPQGIDAQVFRTESLRQVAATVTDQPVREHVSLHFYEHPETYRIIHLMPPPRFHRPELRCQLDYPEDLAFIRAVYDRLLPVDNGTFGIADILDLLEREPALAALNADCRRKPVR